MTKKIGILLLVTVLMVTAVPQKVEAKGVLNALHLLMRLLGQWPGGKPVGDFAGRTSLARRIREARLEIGVAKKQIQQEPIIIKSSEDHQRTEILDRLDRLEAAMGELYQHVFDGSLSNDELLEICKSNLEDRIRPLDQELDSLAGHLMRIESTENFILTEVRGLKSESLETAERVNGMEDQLVTVLVTQANLDKKDRVIIKEIGYLKQELSAVNKDIRRIDNENVIRDDWIRKLLFRTRTLGLVGMQYQLFKFSESGWNDRYESLPFDIQSAGPFHSTRVSAGIWFKQVIYIEGGLDYIPYQRQRIRQDGQGTHYDLYMEGLGWSAVGLISVTLIHPIKLEFGGGITRNNFEISYRAVDKYTQLMSQKEHLHRRTEDPLVIAGLRIGGDHLSVIARVDAVVIDEKVRGYFARFGLQAVP
ncbi:MAG: hypothetical protein OEV49_03655 [candidate division Zixibacteria bacterium]|nr:hypothetical protein [candidate division Zixibacteria bacterium]MDH4034545.1 hypothetical protein [candidate division Zixibacteria bacterium]